MDFKITKQWTKRVLLMIISVMIMGFCVSLLVLTDMGTDPCSAMNYGGLGWIPNEETWKYCFKKYRITVYLKIMTIKR